MCVRERERERERERKRERERIFGDDDLSVMKFKSTYIHIQCDKNLA